MEVIQEKRANMLFISLKGSIDENNSRALEENLIRLIDNGGKELIVDCSQIEYINNAGLRTLLNVAKKALDAEGRIALHSLSQSAKEIFDKTGFSMVSRIYETREEAIANVAASGLLTQRDKQRFLSNE
jgi:anti-sigma B factor antagonist